MTKFKLAATVPALALVLSAGAASALSFDADVTPDVIFGKGNANGGFTVDRKNGIELGLRGKLRFNDSNRPESTYNSDGAGTYTFQAGNPPTGFGFDQNSPTTPVWNFDWSVNSNFDGTGNNLDALSYLFELDTNPGAGTNFTNSFDPINLPYADHAIGDNNSVPFDTATGTGGGTVAADGADYADLIANNNVAQNSWNYEFFNDTGGQTVGFNPNAKGEYLIRLSAVDQNGGSVASTEITINVVPVPAALPLLLTVFGGLGLAARYRRKTA